MTREQAIEEMVLHYLSGSYENAMRLPKFLTQDDLAPFVRETITKLYDALSMDVGLGPDMLAMLEFSSRRDENLSYFRDYFAAVATERQPLHWLDDYQRDPMLPDGIGVVHATSSDAVIDSAVYGVGV
jgi:hypothetical protein